VGISDDRWFFNGATDVVVGEAELVGERFDQVWGAADAIVNHSVTSRAGHTLFGSDGDEVELVGVLVGDCGVDHCSWERILVAAGLTCKEPSVDSLAAVDVHELAGFA